MKTQLHLKLEKMCRILRKEPKHWFIVGGNVVYVPEMREAVTTKRAIYAAFVGDIPEGMEVRATCEASHCAAPDHVHLVAARTKARPLSLSAHVDALKKPSAFVAAEPAKVLPKGLDLDLIVKVKTLASGGSSMAQIKMTTKLEYALIAKIRNGGFDELLRRKEWRAERKKILESPRRSDHVEVEKSAVDADVSDPEQEWLRRMLR